MTRKKRKSPAQARIINLALARAGSISSLARAICRNRCSVLAWINGEKMPTNASMAKLNAYLYGSPTAAEPRRFCET